MECISEYAANVISAKMVEERVHETCNEVKTKLKKCVEQRVKTIGIVKDLAAELDKHHINVARAKVVGSLGKLIGTGVATVGATAAAIVLSPFTAGLSVTIPAAMAVAGGGLITAGDITCIGADFVESILSKLNVKEAEKAVEIDKSLCERFRNSWEKLQKVVKNIKESLYSIEVTTKQIFSVVWQTFSKLEELFGNFDRAVSILGYGTQMVSKVEGLVMYALNFVSKRFSIAEKYFSVVGGSISTIEGIIVIPFDFYTLIRNAIILFGDEPSQTGNKLRSQANDLLTSLNSMRDMRNALH